MSDTETLIHSWSRGELVPDFPSGGPVFTLDPGQYRLVSDLALELFLEADDPPVSTKIKLTKEGVFNVVAAPANYSIYYPDGGKGHSRLLQLQP
jgi:hypothetical protein